jgi:hypothetical protein
MNIRVGKTYKNKKTQSVYVVLHIGRAAWDLGQRLIIYQQMDSKLVWVRSKNEFQEKFEEL